MISILSQRTQLKWNDARTQGDGLFSILHSDYKWRKARNQHIKRECCCQMCGIKRKLEVHHVEPWHLAPELRYEPSNLITLCRECHFRFGHWLNWKDSNPGIKGLCKYAQAVRTEGDKHNEETIHIGIGAIAGCNPIRSSQSRNNHVRLE